MRVNPNLLPDLLAAIEQTQQQINTGLEQISSGRRVNVPSDDPAAASVLVRTADQSAETDQFLHSLGSIEGSMQNADSALSSVVTALQRAISLGVAGANGTLNSTDRAAIVTEVLGIQSQLVSLANLSYQGVFVFAGTATQTPPYVLDASVPSGVRYVGNSGANRVTLGNSFSIQTSLPGSQVFSEPGNDIFQAVQDLITALQNGTGIDNAVTAIGSAYNHLNGQRVFYGNAVNQLDAQKTYLNSKNMQLSQQADTAGGADLPAAISNLTKAQTSYEATLAAVARTSQTNLFSFLK